MPCRAQQQVFSLRDQVHTFCVGVMTGYCSENMLIHLL